MPGPDDDRVAADELDGIRAGAELMLAGARERAHLLRALLAAIDQNERTLQIIMTSESAGAAQSELMTVLGIDEVQARAVLDMQYRRLAGRERDQLTTDYNSLAEQIEEYEAIIGSAALRQELAGTDRGRYLLERGRPDR